MEGRKKWRGYLGMGGVAAEENGSFSGNDIDKGYVQGEHFFRLWGVEVIR
jgi:hypothetical protein